MLVTAGAAGGVAGGILGPSLIAKLGRQRSVQLALLLFPIPFLVIGLTSSPIAAAAALFVEMLAALLWNIVTVSYRQRLITDVARLIPDVLLSRVNSLCWFFGWGLMPIGALAGDWMETCASPGTGRGRQDGGQEGKEGVRTGRNLGGRY